MSRANRRFAKPAVAGSGSPFALFCPDAATAGPQKKALAQAQEKWRGFARAAREAADKNRRLYCSLGFLGGAALFILLC